MNTHDISKFILNLTKKKMFPLRQSYNPDNTGQKHTGLGMTIVHEMGEVLKRIKIC